MGGWDEGSGGEGMGWDGMGTLWYFLCCELSWTVGVF